MLTSSTVIFSMGSGERKRCSNMAPVRKSRSLAWIKARRLPGVRCSTLNTECRSLLCLMIMPGRSWVAGIDIAAQTLLKKMAIDEPGEWRDKPQLRRTGIQSLILHGVDDWGNASQARQEVRLGSGR